MRQDRSIGDCAKTVAVLVIDSAAAFWPRSRDGGRMMDAARRNGLVAGLAALLVGALALSAADARGRHAVRASPGPVVTLHQGGCRFQPPVESIFQRLSRQLAGQPANKVWVRASFSFGRLHGVGVAMESHLDFSGHELYFREDQAALQRALTGSGLHVDRHGDVVEATKFVDGGHQMVSVSIHGIAVGKAHPHFPAARSWLGCGSL